MIELHHFSWLKPLVAFYSILGAFPGRFAVICASSIFGTVWHNCLSFFIMSIEIGWFWEAIFGDGKPFKLCLKNSPILHINFWASVCCCMVHLVDYGGWFTCNWYCRMTKTLYFSWHCYSFTMLHLSRVSPGSDVAIWKTAGKHHFLDTNAPHHCYVLCIDISKLPVLH